MNKTVGRECNKKGQEFLRYSLGGSDWGGRRETLFFKIVISSSLWIMTEDVMIAFELLFSGLEFTKSQITQKWEVTMEGPQLKHDFLPLPLQNLYIRRSRFGDKSCGTKATSAAEI